MDVVGLVPARDHASARYRVAQFAKHLHNAGMTLRLEPLARGACSRFRQLTVDRSDQVVLLQRKLLPLWQLSLLRRSTRALVYDFDDAVYYRDSFHRRGPYSVTRWVRFCATVKAADSIIAGNDYLADMARRFTDADKLCVIPTCVNAHRYQVAEHDDHQPTRLVWIGSSSTVQSLESARDLLEAIGQAIPNAMLRVICDKFPKFNHLPVERADWSTGSEAKKLRTCDIGISWIPDDQWSRGKCGLKILQYMAAGLPVIASPVGVHSQILGKGPGMLARTADEWINAIGALVQDFRLRRDMGLEGRHRLERHFHVDAWGPVLAARLAEAVSRS